MSTTKSPAGVITCKAAVLRKAGEPLQVEEIQVDPPKSHEIRIKMLCASICNTDYICCTYDLLPFFPVVHGHEGVGMVESVGDKVTNLKEGDIVVPLYVGECGECQSCRSGKTNLCQKYPVSTSGLMLDGTSRMTSMQGEKIYHHMSCATWSEYTVVEAGYAVKVDPALPLPHASLLACGFTTGFGSTYRVVNIEKGSTVAVLGLGAVGLGVVKGAQMQEAAKIIGIDINDLKAEKARNFGITDFINPKDHCDKAISELVKDATGGFGVDYFFECTGVQSLLNEALEGSKLGFGTAVLLGVGAESVEVKLVPLIYGRTVKGCLYGGVRPHSDLPNIIHKCVNKEINLDELITHEFSLAEINKGFEQMKHPDTIKIVLKF